MKVQFDFGDISPKRYFLTLGTIIALAFTFITADDEDWFLLSLAQWLVQIFVPLIFAMGLLVLCQKSRFLNHQNAWLKLVLSGTLASIAFAPIAFLLDSYSDSLPLPTSVSDWVLSIANEFWGVLGPVLVVWASLNFPLISKYKLQSAYRDNPEPQELKYTDLKISDSEQIKQTAEDSSTERPNFLSGLSWEPGIEDIYAISAALHYIEIITSKGKELVLYNLKDAINEMPEGMGAQCHRSHWVAFDAIEKFEQNGREAIVKLKDGHSLPVSRSKLNLVKSKLETSN